MFTFPKGKVFIIAEAGSNHGGDLNKAKELIDIASDAGADAVKFQSFQAEDLLVPTDPDFDLVQSIELPDGFLEPLKKHADTKEIIFCSTPFDINGADRLDQLGMPFVKIASGDITYRDLLCHVARLSKPIILSTGKSLNEDIDRALQWIKESGGSEVVLLHCVARYPALPEEMNLNVLTAMREHYGLAVGLSDHTENSYLPAMAVCLGATVIEKHFTYDKNAPGPDHSYALNPDQLKEMVRLVREAEQALGDGIKQPAEREQEQLLTGRRGIYAARALKKGEELKQDDVLLVRPQIFLPAYVLDQYLGRRLKNETPQYKPLRETDFAE